MKDYTNEATTVLLPANALRRFSAILIDWTVCALLASALCYSLNAPQEIYLVSTSLLFFYSLLLDKKGSIGKRLMRIRIVNEVGGFMDMGQNMGRAISKCLNFSLVHICYLIIGTENYQNMYSFAALLYVVNILSFFGGSSQLLHDRASKTFVVNEEPSNHAQ